MLSLIEILKIRGIDTNQGIKVVRHQDSRFDVHEIYRKDNIEVYQAIQKRSVFDGAEILVSFIGIENTKAKFIGMYRNHGKRRWTDLKKKPVSRDGDDASLAFLDSVTEQHFWYDLEPLPAMDDLKDRLIVKWGTPSSARSWVQSKLDKEVVEILPKGYVMPFPGFQDIILPYSELVKLIGNPEANREWYNKLSEVAGIYLIVDSATGKQYIGSAAGGRGIWGRWKSYVKSGHGGNKKLREIIGKDPQYVNNFQFTVLRTLANTLTQKEVIEFEKLYKKKLGTKAFGLNSN